ncbi:MAG TPA: metallophosphoesterase family protein [Candidatus Levilactobacillus faecigallinarum]|uniref:Metallophosphoesterase family protein n=1 Tax=Candidatus Levilactobacillus faecigallinarum TaxID=2838638 RepID=A0A9D1U5W1_9LACO|nr:metallophosphoesterase family protein [Candidatus Levilactobacillus faecigallinarum]
MHKIAVISDVHGNVTALQAVISDAQQAGCTDFWFMGDLFVPGPGAHDLLALLDSLPITAYVRGNWEHGLIETLDGQIDLADPSDVYESLIDDYVRRGLSADEERRIRHLRLLQIVHLDGLTFQLSHNLPTKDSGHTLIPTGEQSAFDEMVGQRADVAVYGHTHHQLFRQTTAGQLIINPGTVGMPFPHWHRFATDLRAQYAIVTTNGVAMPDVDLRKVTYDAEAEIALAQQRGLPYVDLYAEQLRTGVVHTHDNALLARETQRLGYGPRVATMVARYSRS